MPGRRPPARLAAVVAPFCLFVAVILGVLAVGEPAPATAVTPATTPDITVTTASPTVATDGASVTVRGTIRNSSGKPLPRPTITIVAGPAATTRAATRDWAASTAPVTGTTLGTTRLASTLAPGQRGSWRITVARPADHLSGSFGVVPISVQGAGAATHTFIAAQRTKEYEPLGVTWVVPLTLDADADLFGAAGADRLAAWQRAIGPQSRLRRLL
ncbi:DUF6049 family protein, partial [Kribbia dieselivorans]|uniref:DUF6049 family protein n=1 Tax=Kribbia dieselivorans TaxID=331526 RepID=UPI001FE1F47D